MLSFKKVCALSILLAGHLQANDWVELQKLTAGDELGNALFGYSAALSADGNVLVIGGPEDDKKYGATWVYRKQTDGWHQEGTKLLGNDAEGTEIYQGADVAISADGNRFATGAPYDNNNTGTVWIFEHNTDPLKPQWTQMGNKISSRNLNGTSNLGFRVALSGDGKKLATGAPLDNNYHGATLIYEYDGIEWQEGPKLVSQDTDATSLQGYAVALSGDGSVLAVGAPFDDNNKGAVLVYKCVGKFCVQEGKKIVATDATEDSVQGFSVVLSTDGKTLAISGIGDDSSRGAVWVYTYDGQWQQQGTKLVGSKMYGLDQFGYSLALSSISNILLVGGNHYYQNTGGVWKYIKTSDNQWVQDGKPIFAKNAGIAHQGCAVALSAAGDLAVTSGPYYKKNQGAVWIFGKPEIQASSSTKDYYFYYWVPPVAAVVAGLITFGLKYIIKKHCCNNNESLLPTTMIKFDAPLVPIEHRGSFA